MPILTIPISREGAVVAVGIGVGGPRIQAMKLAGLVSPSPIIGRGLIDTGASTSAIDQSVIQALGLVPTGSASILTPSTGTTPHECNQYDVALFVLMEPPHVHLVSLTTPVIEANLAKQGFQALIGRDVLDQGLICYNGRSGFVSLAF